jgi:hypothetical protein
MEGFIRGIGKNTHQGSMMGLHKQTSKITEHEIYVVQRCFSTSAKILKQKFPLSQNKIVSFAKKA